jgi:hypothetical protein
MNDSVTIRVTLSYRMRSGWIHTPSDSFTSPSGPSGYLGQLHQPPPSKSGRGGGAPKANRSPVEEQNEFHDATTDQFWISF